MAQVDDQHIFDEVDERLHHDRMHELWLAYRGWLIGGLVAFFGALITYVGVRDYRQSQANAASDAYRAALSQLQADPAKGQDALLQVIGEHAGDGYGQLARLQLAAALMADKKNDEALHQLETLANEASDPALRSLALLNAAYAVVDSDINKALGYANRIEEASAYRAHALELMGLAAQKGGDTQQALARYAEAMKKGPPAGLRDRLALRLERLGGAEALKNALPSAQQVPAE
ncbi:tetratricopeptide repeat protein [Magnetofaba australis]|uniref:Ancillary SecYEG translocon subunit/Cell division coordinator CpoB TPR domain-containing protein n=1 Tax=Magnetofaba australis IT-1 TaxID=1434232 RepID=A0A1Y2K7V1_9PROT|nr:tetratricopeptide repeat protein [Magnetofaba australis]OSM06275.1 hypothetical protein MAIT1_01260 [Magnetofaba australis IT-1]